MKEINSGNIKDLDKEGKYKTVILSAKALVDSESNCVANMANIASLLYHSFDYYSWVGFYLFDEVSNGLVLGPFQGKVACTRIEIGKGVCGTAALRKETVVVEDVNKFPGHIFCDPDSKSEIVVPLIAGNKLFGVLDADSSAFASFDDTDRKKLEELINEISHIFG